MDQPPQDPELRTIIDKLAQFVARNGPEFEQMTKNKQKGNPKFAFLFGGDYYHYYVYKVNAEQAILRQQQHRSFQSSAPAAFSNYGGGPQGHYDPWQHQQQPHQHQSYHHQEAPPASRGSYESGAWSSSAPPSAPRPLMEINTSAASSFQHHQQGPLQSHQPPTNVAPPTGPLAAPIEELERNLSQLSQQQQTLRDQIEQSEQNLKAQYEVTIEQQKAITKDVITKAKWDRLNEMAESTGIGIDEMETVMHPIIESCTKDSISCGKSWIFQNATSHENNQLIAHYLAYRVTQEDAKFSVKLHLIYLMNDVLHHCVRKNAEALQQSLESVAVEMFCSAWVSGADEQKPKLKKLIKLWEDKSIFSSTTLSKMHMAEESWEVYKEQMKELYSGLIAEANKQSEQTYQNYKLQHQNFVSHATNSIKNLETKKIHLQEQITASKQQQNQAPETLPPFHYQHNDPHSSSFDTCSSSQDDRDENINKKRGSRWDTGQPAGNIKLPVKQPPFSGPPPQGMIPPSAPVVGAAQKPNLSFGNGLPDMSRPPPGFSAPPPSASVDDKALIPKLPYFELPAALMVDMVKMEDNEYKPIDPKKLRLPPPTPPSERLLQALEMFYAPPSHERPRDPEGWEMIGLYEWYRDKAEAIKKKEEDIKSGKRQPSRSPSPDPFSDDNDKDDSKDSKESNERKVKEKKRTYEEDKGRGNRDRRRNRRGSRSRSRTRSRSRESTPDESKRRSLSQSPPSSRYSLPSHLTKRSPSPDDRSPSPPRHRKREQRPRSPPTFNTSSHFSAMSSSRPAERLDSSNKGHQLMQKMGWKGSGLGSNEAGITEPISGGEVRDRSEQYRGVGVGNDPFEQFRKAKSGSFYTRIRESSKNKNKP